MTTSSNFMSLEELTAFTTNLLNEHTAELCDATQDPYAEGEFFGAGQASELAAAIKNCKTDTVHLTVSLGEDMLGGMTLVNQKDSEGSELGTEVYNYSEACKHLDTTAA